jgi:AcrR family transcriptional regulator
VPPSEKVSREAIVTAALALVERAGIAALTARSVAAELTASTAPVYRHFQSMDELARAVMERARDQLLAYTERVYTDRPFLNMGMGIALFARDHPRLYHALFLESDQFEGIVRGLLERLTDDMRKDARFSAMDRQGRATLLDRMWTYTHGLASLIAVGLARDTRDEALLAQLGAVGGAVIRDALAGGASPPPASRRPKR